MGSEMPMEKFVNDNADNEYPQNNLFSFAFCGVADVFSEKKLPTLAAIAEPEQWDTGEGLSPHDILFYYLTYTYSRCFDQNKIVYSGDGVSYCAFNTGLLTKNGEDVLCLFEKNQRSSQTDNVQMQKWFLIGFFPSSDRSILSCDFHKKAELATWWSSPEECYFHSEYPISLNIDHILDDHWEEENIFPDELKAFGKEMVLDLIQAAFGRSEKRIQRNSRLVVPQWYKNKLMFLMPITLNFGKEKQLTLALALEPLPNAYRANTVFSLKTAYKKARLINRPESNWLIAF